MKKKFRAAVSDPLFIRAVCFFAAMAGLGVIAALLYGRERFRYLLQAIYVLYAPLLFFFVRDVIVLYRRYFREKKQKKESKIKKKIKAFFSKIEEKVRSVLDMKPKSAYFGGVDESEDAPAPEEKKRHKKHVSRGIAWSSIRENELKIRYLYAERVNGGIKNGADIKPSDTAREARGKLQPEERDELLFGLYERVRYGGGNEPVDDGTVSFLSERAQAPVKGKKRKKEK